MKITEFRKLIREEIRKVVNEEYEITLKGTPKVKVIMGDDTVTITQQLPPISKTTSTVKLSIKQFAELIENSY